MESEDEGETEERVGNRMRNLILICQQLLVNMLELLKRGILSWLVISWMLASCSLPSASVSESMVSPLVPSNSPLTAATPAAPQQLTVMWLTYEDPTLGYTLQYPQEFLPIQLQTNEPLTIMGGDVLEALMAGRGGFQNPRELGADSILIAIGVYSRQIAKEENLQEWFAEQKEIEPGIGITSEQPLIGSVTISDRDALSITLPITVNSQIYLIRNDLQVYFIQKWPAVSSYDAIFTEMLNSFRISP
jgi:hypothetical protein